jgi:hypothetical protein
MHLSGKLFQLIDNKNKTMIVEMKEPSVIRSPCCCFYIILLVFFREKNMLKLKWGNILFDPNNLPTIWFFIPQNEVLNLSNANQMRRDKVIHTTPFIFWNFVWLFTEFWVYLPLLNNKNKVPRMFFEKFCIEFECYISD